MINFFNYLVKIFIPILLVILINLLIDKRALINQNYIKSFEKSLRKIDLSVYFNIPERKLAKLRIENFNNSSFKNMITGSSRVMMIGKNTNHKVFNLGMSNFTFNDFLYISELINNSSIAIDTFILGIDPILFNENSPLDQWKNFHNDLNLGKLRRFVSIKYLMQNVSFPNYSNWDGNKNDYVKFSDGSIRYHINDREQEVTSTIENQIVKNLENYKFINTELYNLFINKLNNINANKIILILNPYNPIIYNELIELFPILQKVEDRILLLENEKIIIIGSFNPYNIALSKYDFNDQVHLNKNGIKKTYSMIQSPIRSSDVQ